jgi:hypothetical protein
MSQRWTKVVAAVLVTLAAGCGSMLNGTRQSIRISTIPPRAKVTVDGQTFTAPGSIDLTRDEDHHVTVEAPGFEPKRAVIESYPDSAPAIYNCLVALCIPQLWESERMTHYKLAPTKVEIGLDPVGWSPR